MSAVGFEPTRIAPRELESRALDRSAKLTHAQLVKLRNNQLGSIYGAVIFRYWDSNPGRSGESRVS